MKDWRTSLAGFLPGLLLAGNALLEAYVAGYFDGQTGKQLLVSVGLFLIGWYAKDKNVTGVEKQKISAEAQDEPIVGKRPDDR